MKLGRYEVVRELGKGAMGIVYLAKDPLIGRLVALKTIRAAAHADDDETKEFKERFIREAQAAGILNHPAIVTVFDIGQDEPTNTSFIAMEFVEGQNLKEVLTQGRALSFDQIGDIVAQVAEGLDFAHAKGIVHRDVKPANIILLEGNRAKITDFGIAKIASGGANLTTTGQFLGTPNYMAPEQIKGAPVDGRTDIFSLGICLYECLTRRKPFGGDSLTSISYKIVHEPFPPLQEINPQIPPGYDEVVANCLAKDPAKRYQRARDAANALRAVIRGERPVRPVDPAFAEETIVTRDRTLERTTERDEPLPSSAPIPTIEVPFPDANDAAAVAAGAAAAPIVATPAEVGGSTRPANKNVRPTVAASAPTVAKPAPPTVVKTPRPPSAPIGQQLRTTLTNVRALPLWRRRVPPAIFIGIVVLLVAGLIGAVAAVRSRDTKMPPIDRRAEMRRAREKQLREEGSALLRQGRVTDAYVKFAELQKLAPKSPFVVSTMEKLNAIRLQEEVGKQQLAQAQAKYDEGMALYNAKKFDEAIVRFQESLTLNPNALQSADALKAAQQEQQKALAAKAAKKQTPRNADTSTAVAAHDTPGSSSTATQSAASSQTQLTTVFVHPFTDGRIVVRAGADIVANEKLFDERPARFLRRASRTARPVSTTKDFPAKNADVQVWITVPAAGIQEHHILPAFRFAPGGQHRLVVRYDAASKQFNYELN
ncbi:MAG: protein kinase [Acidobacteriota bacterium]|nr:protein kinase [Acidobacteriota bacterium]